MKAVLFHSLTIAALVCLAQPALGQDDKTSEANDSAVPPQILRDSHAEQQNRTTTFPGVNPSELDPHSFERRILETDRENAFQPRDRTYSLQQHAALQEMHAREQQMRAQFLAVQEELARQQARNLPPLENGKLHAYRLQHIDPALLAETLESFLGTSQLRLVPDVDNNILLTYASEQVSEQISNLVKVLDAENDPNASPSMAESEKAQSLLIRLFWLADGFGTDEPRDYLPLAVIQAVNQLGLREPQLVSQSAAALACKQGEEREFEFRFPALFGGQTLQFESQGSLMLSGQPQLNLHVRVHSDPVPIELAGTLSAPLGHYMVLGTANYASAAQMANASGRSGGFGGGGGSGGGGGFGFGGGGGYGGEYAEQGRGEYGSSEQDEDAAEVTSASSKLTSRFAFVVQLIEAESFEPEESGESTSRR